METPDDLPQNLSRLPRRLVGGMGGEREGGPRSRTEKFPAPGGGEWLGDRRANMPVKCLEAKLNLHGGVLTLPRGYIYAPRIAPADTFGPFAKKTKGDPAWRYYE